MQTRVQKWGNSLGLRIPRGLAEEVGLGAGSEVSLSAKDGELVVKPSVPARLSLDDLLAVMIQGTSSSRADSFLGWPNACCWCSSSDLSLWVDGADQQESVVT